MKRPFVQTSMLALALTLAPAAAGFGQQYPGQGNPSGAQGQQAQQRNPQGAQGQNPRGQQAQFGQNQQGQQAQFGQNQQGQQGQPGQNQQGQPGMNQPGQPGGRPASNEEMANLMMGQLVEGGQWRVWSWAADASRHAGMSLAPADDAMRAQLNLAKEEGLIVTAIDPGSPAEAAGLRQNDILLLLDDDAGHMVKLSRPDDLEAGLKSSSDHPVFLHLLRAGKKMSIQVQPRVHVSLGPVQPEPPAYWIGVMLVPIEPALRAQLQISENEGLMVREVEPNGPAAGAGFRPFDILTRFNGSAVDDTEALTILVQAVGEKRVPVDVFRQGKKLEMSVTPERRKSPNLTVRLNQPGVARWEFVSPGAMLPGRMLANQGNARASGVVARDLNNDGTWDLYVTGDSQPSRNVADGGATTARRLDELSAQIKELRQAVEALTRAQQKK